MQLLNLKSIVPDKVSLPAKLYLIGMIFNGLVNGVVSVVLLLYLLSLGLNSEAIGSLFMMMPIGTALLTIPAGILADRYGKKHIVLIGLSISWIAKILALTTRSVEVFRLAFLLFGVSNAAWAVWTPIYSSFLARALR